MMVSISATADMDESFSMSNDLLAATGPVPLSLHPLRGSKTGLISPLSGRVCTVQSVYSTPAFDLRPGTLSS